MSVVKKMILNGRSRLPRPTVGAKSLATDLQNVLKCEIRLLYKATEIYGTWQVPKFCFSTELKSLTLQIVLTDNAITSQH